MDNELKNKILDITCAIVKKYIWDCKLRFTVPNFANLKEIFMDFLGTTYKNVGKFRELLNKTDLFHNHQEIRF